MPRDFNIPNVLTPVVVLDNSGLMDRSWYNYLQNLGSIVGSNGEINLQSFTDTTRPSPTDKKGSLIYSDTDGMPIYSDGTNWRKVTDGSIT